MLKVAVITLVLIDTVFAQIASSSFFPNMKSLNPGVSHLREQGFLSANYAVTNVEKTHDVTLSSLDSPIKTELSLNKTTFFRAGKGRGPTIELLFDKESAEKKEDIKSSSLGDRTVETEAESSYYGGILDLGFIGVQVAQADYSYDYIFRVGSIPNLTARDLIWARDYSLLKIGTAFKFKGITLGAFSFVQKSDGSLDYTFYDPTTGNKGSTENYLFNTETKGYGFGIGYSNPALHLELSLEKTNSQSLSKPSDFPVDLSQDPQASRISTVAEVKLKWFTIGMRVRKIEGNFYDLEDIITANLLYNEMSASDSRTDTTFNFSFGSQKGLSFSAFYSSSEVNTNEESDIFANDELYAASTKTTAYGLSMSYVY